MASLLSSRFVSRLAAFFVSLLALASAGRAAAQTRYFDRGHWLLVESAQDGQLVLRTEDGRRVDVGLGTDRVIVTLGTATDLAGLGVVVDEVLSARTRIVAVRSAVPAQEGALALAERLAPLVVDGMLRSAVPDLALPHARSSIAVPPNDPRYGGQWFFQTIGIERAWRHEDGDPSVTVAVVDDGCDLTHPDLAAHMLPGYDALDDDDDPSFLPSTNGNNHGTSCAGLVAAVTDNATDVAGTCPECSLRCVRLLGADGTLIPTSTDVRAYDFVLMHDDVAVVSNSWGFTASVPVPGPLADVLMQVLATGHGGLGASVVFAAGNDSRLIQSDELEALPGLVTVGATTMFDEATSFSNRGECLALVSPVGTLTTDIAGPDGEDPGDTTSNFGGTSSSCPIVAGVLGLMVSRVPTLGVAALRTALVESVRPAPFATPDANGHDLTYGFGIVDPAAALATIDPSGVPDAGVEDAGVDAGARDDAAVVAMDASSTPTPPASSGCACRVGERSGSGGLSLVVAGVLALVLARRRRAAAAALLVLGGCAVDPAVAATEGELRPDTPGTTEMMPNYAATDTVESIVSPGGSFRIHFTRSGTNAVNPRDDDANGTPDFVDYVAQQYDEVLARYTSMGFRAPRTDENVPVDHGGDALFDVYLLDFGAGAGADGAFRREDCIVGSGCSGYMVMENDFVGFSYPSPRYGARLLASHELFHAVQAAYDDALGAQGSTLSESTAVWASERFDPAQTDLEGFSTAFLERPDRSLGIDPIGPVQPYAYGAALAWEYYATRFGDDLVVAFWEELDVTAGASVDNWLDVLDTVLTRDHASSFRSTYVDMAEWLMFTGVRFDADHGPARGSQLAPVATTDVTVPYQSMTLRVFPASTRYFTVPSPRVSVRLAGAAPEELAVIAAGFTGDGIFVADARGMGSVDLVATGATTIVVGVANGATSGTSNAVTVCIGRDPVDCTAMPDDAGAMPDAGVAADASAPMPTPAPAGCACASAPRAPGASVPLAMLLGIAWRVARRRASAARGLSQRARRLTGRGA